MLKEVMLVYRVLLRFVSNNWLLTVVLLVLLTWCCRGLSEWCSFVGSGGDGVNWLLCELLISWKWGLSSRIPGEFFQVGFTLSFHTFAIWGKKCQKSPKFFFFELLFLSETLHAPWVVRRLFLWPNKEHKLLPRA